LLVVLSLALRSYWVADRIERIRYTSTGDNSLFHRRELISSHGSIYIELLRFEDNTNLPTFDRRFWINQNHWEHSRLYNSDSATTHFIRRGGQTQLGFGYHSMSDSPALTATGSGGQVISRYILLPWYAALLLFSILPLCSLRIALRARVRRARLAANLCPHCGYDLRSSPSSCPECGASPTKAN